jgi:hypothetical protein
MYGRDQRKSQGIFCPVKSESSTRNLTFSIRTALGLYVHDAQLASTFNHDPVLRHSFIRIPAAANEDLFAASTAAQWAGLVRSSIPETTMLKSHLHINQIQHSCMTPLPRELACKNSRFSCYVLLHGIGAAVQETNLAGQMDSSTMMEYQNALTCWYHAYEKFRSSQEPDPLCLIILYHEIFMSLLVDFDQLERCVGRDGSQNGVDALKYVGVWSSRIEAKRCVIHASLIHRQVGSMRFDSEPAIHVPRSMFLAALAWYCYIAFDQAESGHSQSLEEPLDILESKIFNINPSQHLFEASGFKRGKTRLSEVTPFHGLTDLLSRIGHWGISKKLARILEFLSYGGQENSVTDTT